MTLFIILTGKLINQTFFFILKNSQNIVISIDFWHGKFDRFADSVDSGSDCKECSLVAVWSGSTPSIEVTERVSEP